MKRLFIFISLLATTLVASAQKSTLNCTFNGLENGMRIVVSQAQGGRLVPTDTLTPDAKGNIKLERSIVEPFMMALSLTKGNSPYIHVIMMPKEKTAPVKDMKNPMPKKVPLTRPTTRTRNRFTITASTMPSS